MRPFTLFLSSHYNAMPTCCPTLPVYSSSLWQPTAASAYYSDDLSGPHTLSSVVDAFQNSVLSCAKLLTAHESLLFVLSNQCLHSLVLRHSHVQKHAHIKRRTAAAPIFPIVVVFVSNPASAASFPTPSVVSLSTPATNHKGALRRWSASGDE